MITVDQSSGKLTVGSGKSHRETKATTAAGIGPVRSSRPRHRQRV
jgi:hypothetical protein